MFSSVEVAFNMFETWSNLSIPIMGSAGNFIGHTHCFVCVIASIFDRLSDVAHLINTFN